MNVQREMPWRESLGQADFAPDSVVAKFSSYRDAVIWCWDNRKMQGAGKKMDQALCSDKIGMYAPHFSRCVDPDSKAPMNLPPDFIPDFEAYTGWRAVSQFLASKAQLTYIEEFQRSKASRFSSREAACA